MSHERHDAAAAGFASMQGAFAQALLARPESCFEGNYCVAGAAVRLRIVGGGLASVLCPAFAHLEDKGTSNVRPQLTLEVWDQDETGVGYPTTASESKLGADWLVEGGTLDCSPSGRFLRFKRPASLTWFDRKRGRLVEWRASRWSVSLNEQTKPFRLPFRVWLGDRDMLLSHAGLVSWGGRGALIGGEGGAGKSTTTLACVRAGLAYLGDDYVALEEKQRDGSFVGHSVYGSARLERHHLSHFPTLERYAIHSSAEYDPKSLLLVASVFPDRLERAVPIRAVLLPRVVDADLPCLRPVSNVEALLALAPTTLTTTLGPGPPGLQRLARLVEAVPRYRLELGRELKPVPALVQQALRESGAEGVGRDDATSLLV